MTQWGTRTARTVLPLTPEQQWAQAPKPFAS